MLEVFNFTTASGRQPVDEFINQQITEARIKIDEVIYYFKQYGFHLETEYLRRLKGTKKLWELRIKYQSKQYRIFLAKLTDNTVVLLHSIVKKTVKTPLKEIKTAESRLRQLEANLH